MKNQHNLSAEVTSTSTPATGAQPSSSKALYNAPQLTVHGQLEQITQQTNSTPPAPGGDTG